VATSSKTTGSALRPPAVRLAPRDELAAAARVAPLLRAARDLARWAAARQAAGQSRLSDDEAESAAADLDLTEDELDAAWQVAAGVRLLGSASARQQADILSAADPDEVLTLWDDALGVMLRKAELEDLVTALYTVGGPVRIDALFEAYDSARHQIRPDGAAGQADELLVPSAREHSDVVGVSAALETLADLGAVDLGSDEEAGVLTVALSRLGTWGVHTRLRARGWQVPVLGQLAQDRAAVLLAALADYDAEEGEAEIAAWLALRGPREAAAELIEAAGQGSPGLRGAAFAVLDRVGEEAIPPVREALGDPVLRPHAVVWLRDHGEQAEMARGDQEWLLVDLGAGLLEEAEPEDVVAELLPDLPSGGQAGLVAGLWDVEHPGLLGLLTALGEHHHDPAVAKAARKAAFKARSRDAAEAGGALTGRHQPRLRRQ
jgi:hypothetical protein